MTGRRRARWFRSATCPADRDRAPSVQVRVIRPPFDWQREVPELAR